MMKKLVLISLICVVSAVTMPVSADLISDADSAYVNDQFDRAVELYDRAVDSLGGSSERYYNLGNAYFRSGHPGMAIVSYERALRLDPTDSDVRDNLEFVNSRITDRIDAGDSFINNSVDSIAVSLHPDTWGVIALVTFLLMLAGVLVYFMDSGIMLRKVGFFGAGILLIVTVVANFLAYRAAGNVTATDRAVIIQPSVILSTTPRQPKDRSEEAFLLHEGTKVHILDSISDPSDRTGKIKWYDVRVDNSHRAWISSESIEII